MRKRSRLCSTLLRENVNSKFLVNISFLNQSNKGISNFFGFGFTRDSYIKLFKKINIKGFNNNFNRNLCLVNEELIITDCLKQLYLKEVKEEIAINSIIINQNEINIYNKKEYFIKIFNNPNLSLFDFNSYLSSFLIWNLQFHLKVVIVQLQLLNEIVVRNKKII